VSGISWQPSASPPPVVVINYKQISIECTLFSSSGEPAPDSQQTFDQLVGVVIDVKHPQVVRGVSRLLNQAPPPHVEKKGLKTGLGFDAELGGTVIAVHQFVSPDFLAYYFVDYNSACRYMQDIRSAHKKDRKIRVALIHHVSNQPIWLQFSTGDSTFLYLSQTASVAEEKWLIIVNHVKSATRLQ
jgi:hypothetical protein